MRTRAALTAAAREELREICARFDYHLVSIEVERPGAGVVRAILNLEPRLIVRSVKIKVAQSWLDTLYRDPLLRRMRLRAGEVLEANQAARDASSAARPATCKLPAGRGLLRGRGHGRGGALAGQRRADDGQGGLGPSYQVGKILIEREAELAISAKIATCCAPPPSASTSRSRWAVGSAGPAPRPASPRGGCTSARHPGAGAVVVVEDLVGWPPRLVRDHIDERRAVGVLEVAVGVVPSDALRPM